MAAKKGKKKGQRGKRPSTRPPAQAGHTAKKATPGTPGSATAQAQKQPRKQSPPPTGTAKATTPKASQSDGKRSTRAERIEAARRARRRKKLAVRFLLVFLVVAVLSVLVVSTMNNRREAEALEKRLTAGDCTFDTRSDRTNPAPNNHVPNPTYAVNPPAGGNHLTQAADAGTYEQGNVPPDGQLVHSLEHGYVIIWHRPDLTEPERQAIRQVASQFERDVLIVPRPTLPTKVASTAWGRRLLCPAPEIGPLEEFIRAYRNQGPEKVEH